MLLALLAADVDPYAFDAAKDNLGMLVMGAIVTVAWLLFRKMLKLSGEKDDGDAGPRP